MKTNDPKQLKILLRKCKQSSKHTQCSRPFSKKVTNTSADVERSLNNSPVKSNSPVDEVKKRASREQKATEKFLSMANPLLKMSLSSQATVMIADGKILKANGKIKSEKRKRPFFKFLFQRISSLQFISRNATALNVPPPKHSACNASLHFENTCQFYL